MSDNNYMLEGFLNGQANELDRQRIELIRILSRSGTLPKVADLQVQYIHSQPEMFLIEPGKQLRIGIRLLQQPVLALVALRYGIEWQIWYNAIKKIDGDSRVADLAAARVAVRFMELLPDDHRAELQANFPDDLKDLYNLFKAPNVSLADLENVDITELSKYHKLEAPTQPLNKSWLPIIEQLAVPTEALMMSGGDLRLNIETKNLLNVYGCRPFPRPEAFSFASSTATSVSNIAFDLTQKQREKLIRDSFKNGMAQAYKDQQTDLFERLRHSLHLGKNASLIISPSGTDISLLFAGMCQTLTEKTICHILVASDETGSGVPMALAGRHFADTSALNIPVKKEGLIEGFRDAEVRKIPLRNEAGKLKLRQELDAEVYTALQEALEKGCQPVLHVMDQSKLGYAAPTHDLLEQIRQKFGEKVIVLVDNSQLRMHVSRIEAYLKRGYIITVTGSKFYTGPPFSGALVMPPKFADRVRKCEGNLPLGFNQYYLKSEFVPDTKIGNKLADGYNFGSYLRWFAALVEIERYYRIPVTLRNLGTEIFCEHVAMRIQNSPFLEPLEVQPVSADLPLAEEARTIFPFYILRGGRALSQPEADKLYRLLNQDISALLPDAADDELRIARQVCHIGQPVKVLYHNQQPSAVVRISLGSRILAESWKDRDVSIFFQRVESQMNQVDIVVSKIGLVLKYSDSLLYS